MIKFIKQLFFPLYLKFISLLIRDLKISETIEGIKNIQALSNKLTQDLEIIADYQQTINTVFLNLNTNEELLSQNKNTAYQDLLELKNIISKRSSSLLPIIDFFSKIDKYKNIELKNKSVCMIGYNGEYVYKELKRRGVKKFLAIEPTGAIMSKIERTIINSKYSLISIFPTEIGNIDLGQIDIIFVPEKLLSSFLIKNDLFNLGEKVRESLIFYIDTLDNSIYSQKQRYDSSEKGKNNFNDNYLRKKVHENGFFEIQCIYTYGKLKDNYFDKKISHFNYESGFKIIKSNKVRPSSLKLGNSDYSNKIYVAFKLPLNISK